MVYHQKLVACIKVNGQILRESDSTVSIPFGSEYSVLIKNLNSKRVMAKVSVDGKDATDGTWLVIGPNQSVELERYISNGNLASGNRFKFIPMTKAVEKHRGIKSEDGLVRIEYKTEKVTTTQDVHITRTHHHDVHVYDYTWPYWPYYRPYRGPYYFGEVYCGGISGVGGVQTTLTSTSEGSDNFSFTSSSLGDAQMGNTASVNMMAFNKSEAASPTVGGLRSSLMKSASPLRSSSRSLRPQASASAGRRVSAKSMRMQEASLNDIIDDSGITVPGSESHQQFQSVSGFATHEQSEIIVLKLRGVVDGVAVAKPVTVKTKATCPTCGKKSKGDKKFCAACGTSLSLI